MAAGDTHHVVQAAWLKAAPEGGGAVAGVRDDEGDVGAPGLGLIDHVQGQLPLHMADVGGDCAPFAAGLLAGIGLRTGGSQVLGRNRRQFTAAELWSDRSPRRPPGLLTPDSRLTYPNPRMRYVSRQDVAGVSGPATPEPAAG